MKQTIIRKLKEFTLIRGGVYRYRRFKSRFNYISGSGNIIQNHAVFQGSKIQVSGDNNTIVFENGSVILNAKIKVNGNNCMIVLHKGAYLLGTEIYCEDDNLKLEIGHDTYISASHLAITEGRTLSIGNNCMLADHIQIRTGDSHSIVSKDNGKRINPANNVRIGNHCWIGEGAKIMKGVQLEDDTIVSTGAIVTKSFPGSTLVGGVPARVIKENVTWDESRKI